MSMGTIGTGRLSPFSILSVVTKSEVLVRTVRLVGFDMDDDM
jgi:hypothetical protein